MSYLVVEKTYTTSLSSFFIISRPTYLHVYRPSFMYNAFSLSGNSDGDLVTIIGSGWWFHLGTLRPLHITPCKSILSLVPLVEEKGGCAISILYTMGSLRRSCAVRPGSCPIVQSSDNIVRYLKFPSSKRVYFTEARPCSMRWWWANVSVSSFKRWT